MKVTEIIPGFILEVSNGRVYGALRDLNGRDWDFDMALLDVMESQRVSLEAGSYIYFINGYLFVDNTIWSTYDIDTAQAEAERLFNEIWGREEEKWTRRNP